MVGTRSGVLSIEQEAFFGRDQFHHFGDGGKEVKLLEVGEAIGRLAGLEAGDSNMSSDQAGDGVG